MHVWRLESKGVWPERLVRAQIHIRAECHVPRPFGTEWAIKALVCLAQRFRMEPEFLQRTVGICRALRLDMF